VSPLMEAAAAVIPWLSSSKDRCFLGTNSHKKKPQRLRRPCLQHNVAVCYVTDSSLENISVQVFP